MNNLKQLGLATAMYIQDYDDFIPYGYNPAGTPFSGYATPKCPAWYILLSPYLKLPIYNYYTIGNLVGGNLIYPSSALTCPSQLKAKTNSFRWGVPATYVPITSVAYAGITTPSGIKMGKYTRIKKSSQKAWLMDTSYDSNYFKCFYRNPSIIAEWEQSAIHNRGLNILYFDWSVKWMSVEEAKKWAGNLLAPGSPFGDFYELGW
ncbi:MAG: DUF1559 domain-containing protein [Candidatus Omnitrophica bacterium]|nr:DUF1559 domain-containing protein [Candidatus Omnitrophota bacterium]